MDEHLTTFIEIIFFLENKGQTHQTQQQQQQQQHIRKKKIEQNDRRDVAVTAYIHCFC